MIYVILTKFSLLCSMISSKKQKQKAPLEIIRQQRYVDLHHLELTTFERLRIAIVNRNSNVNKKHGPAD